MSGGVWLDRRRQDIECRHVAMIAVGVILHHLHRFELLEPRFLGYLILTFISIVLEMAYISDVAHIAHFVAQMEQIAVEQVEGDSRTRMAQMGIAIHGGTADIHAYVSLVQRLKCFLKTG